MEKENLIQDCSKAFDLFNRAFNKGCVEALWRVSACLIQNIGVEKDLKLAETFIKKGVKKILLIHYSGLHFLR